MDFWLKVASALGFPGYLGVVGLDERRVDQDLLPCFYSQDPADNTDHGPSPELYEHAGLGDWWLKPEFADLVHDDPYRAPEDLEEKYVQLVAERMRRK